MVSSASVFTTSDSSFARTIYTVHGYVSEPLYRTLEYVRRWGNPLDPKVFDNCTTKVKELAYRTFAPATLVAGALYFYDQLPLRELVVLGAVGEVARLGLHVLGYAAQKKQYIHIRTKAAVTSTTSPIVATFNLLAFPAGLNYTCGGCTPLRNRFSGIVALIREAKADVIVLQELVMDTKTLELFAKEFEQEYAHMFVHNGPNLVGVESGLMVLSKLAVTAYSFTPFNDQYWGMMRGFTMLEAKANPQDATSSFTIIGTHMEAGSTVASNKIRDSQLKQIHDAANKCTSSKAVILAGDTNINMKNTVAVQESRIAEFLVEPYQEGPATCTNVFNRARYPEHKYPDEEWVDQVALVRISHDNVQYKKTEQKVLRAYEASTKTALSDHHLLVATFTPK